MNKKKSKFKKILGIYTLILVFLAVGFLGFVYYNLKSYENNLVDHLLLRTIHQLKDDDLTGYLINNQVNTNLLSTYKEMTKRNDYQFVLTNENTYDAILDGRPLFTIELSNGIDASVLGLLQYEKYEVKKITPHLEKGLIYYTVKIPSNAKLYVNNVLYEEKSSEEEFSNLSYMYYNDIMPKMVTYELTNLEKEATIKVKNFLEEEVELKKENTTYTMENAITVKTQEEAKKYIQDVDIETIAKNWSLFLTKDLTGASYGFSTIRNYVIEGTDMYTKAYNWAHNVDITFTSSHTLENPPFTNVRIENFNIYDENAFTCEVYLEKHMVVKGVKQVDVMHDELAFIKTDGTWKLMNIKGVTEGTN